MGNWRNYWPHLVLHVQKLISEWWNVVEQTNDPQRTTLRLHVTKPAATFLETLREDTGVPKEVALTRIIEWYVSLDPKLRLAVLNRDESTKAELLRLAVAQLSAVGTMPGTLEEAIATADAANARVKELAREYRKMLGEHTSKSKKK